MALEVGQAARGLDVKLPDADGAPHTLGDALANGPVVVGIYKSSCKASKEIFPMLQRLSERLSGASISFFGVSQDSANITRSFARRTGVTFPILVEGKDFPLSHAFEISHTPTIFLVGQDGKVAATTLGFFKMMVNQFADEVATLVGAAKAPLIGDDGPDAEIPVFVPG
jgi:peroxiredoxin